MPKPISDAPVSLRAAPPVRTGMTPPELKRALLDHLYYTCTKQVDQATALDYCRALSHTVRDRLLQRWLETRKTYVASSNAKQICYLSSEFLIGRSLGLALVNLGLYEQTRDILKERGFDIGEVLEAEHDPGLGNGGLGRLAACFMDSLATLDLPAMGYGIRYDFGIFEQQIVDGRQVERRDAWLENGTVPLTERLELAQCAQFGGRVEAQRDSDGGLRMSWVDTQQVVGVPYDVYILGHETNTVGTIRLWSARASRDFDLELFNEGDFLRAVSEKIESENLSKVLYPSDHSDAGKRLRLKQQYFFVACSLADMIRRYRKRGYETLQELPDHVAIQLNDTHPSIAVAELMRILVDQEGLRWDEAWDLSQKTFAYTNHTLLPEALEKWPVAMFEELLPRHLQIIYEINRRFLRKVHIRWPGDAERLRRMSLIEEGPVRSVRMAHLATVGSFSINGVAKLHTDLIQRELLKDFYELWPERFNNKTNGVTPRRWLMYCNPDLSNLISSCIGTAWSHRDFSQLRQLEGFTNDLRVLDELRAVKRRNKERLAAFVEQRNGIQLDCDSMFIVQVKRIHEYKRQILTLLGVLSRYLKIKDGNVPKKPVTYLFAGKAAAGYHLARLHIQLINDVAELINADPMANPWLRVVFVANYGVSVAETIIPAADLSVQNSLAGKEASGTGNMKLAMNGALTIGTLDGANVEIREEVGPENFYLFGLTAPEVEQLRERGYHPQEYIDRSPLLARCLALLDDGFFSREDPARHRDVSNSLRHHDPFMVCADFDSYVEAEEAAVADYLDGRQWARRCLLNIAGSARFSSDETIRQYAEEIWKAHPVPVDLPPPETSRVRR